MSETDEITNPLLAALCKAYPQGLFYRRNVGAMKIGNRYIRFGINGQADIAGIINGRAYEIETKAKRGKQSAAQKNWQRAVERAGGVYVLAYSVDDALDIISRDIIPAAAVVNLRVDSGVT